MLKKKVVKSLGRGCDQEGGGKSECGKLASWHGGVAPQQGQRGCAPLCREHSLSFRDLNNRIRGAG